MIGKIDGHLSKPWRSRRLLLLLSNFVALGLVVYCTLQQVELKGENLITLLVTLNNTAYAVTKVIDKKNGKDL